MSSVRNEITNYTDFDTSKLTFTKLEENDRTNGQQIGYPRYVINNVEVPLCVQLPWINISTYGVPSVNQYTKNDKERSHLKLPLDLNNSEVLEFVNKIKEIKRKSIKKQKGKLYSLLPKAHIEVINKAKKEKKKRVNTSSNGILKMKCIPVHLCNFIGLAPDTLISRPKLFSALNNKFKELGLKSGQLTILDKETATIFGKEEGHVIKFNEAQKFLADQFKLLDECDNDEAV